MNRTLILTIAVTLVPLPALAQKEANPPAAAAPVLPTPKPAPELAALKPLAGSWSCAGHSPDAQGTPADAFKATMTNKWDLGNFWMWFTYQVKPSKQRPKGFTGKGWLGYDAASKKLVWAGVSDTGSWISLRADGWQGDKLTFTGDDVVRMGKQQATFVFSKGASPSEWMLTVTSRDAGGNSMLLKTETCKKVGKATSS